MAATAVDDAFGQMSGYTAIVFDGTYDVLDALRPTKLPSVDGDADRASRDAGRDGGRRAGAVAAVHARAARLRLGWCARSTRRRAAGVLTLNLDDLARYEKPRILMAGDRKIGVVAVDYYASARQLKKLHDELASAGASPSSASCRA